MAKKTTQKVSPKRSGGREIIGIVLIVVALLLLMALISRDPADWPGSSRALGETTHNWMGRYGAFVAHYLNETIGISSYFIALFLLVTGWAVFMHRSLKMLVKPGILCVTLAVFFPLLATIAVDIGSERTIPSAGYGGALGVLFAHLMLDAVGRGGAFMISLAFILIALIISTNMKFSALADALLSVIKKTFGATLRGVRDTAGKSKKKPSRPKKASSTARTQPGSDEMSGDESPFLTPPEAGEESPAEEDMPDDADDDRDRPTIHPRYTERGQGVPVPVGEPGVGGEDSGESGAPPVGEENGVPEDGENEKFDEDAYLLPGTDLLDEPPSDIHHETDEEMLESARNIVRNLRHFNIEADVKHITPGPIVTRYELTLAPGVKVGKVVNLSDDLAMALKAKGPIRILAPIPGKAAIGIEVPNKRRATVYFREIAESSAFAESDQPLVLALGKNTAGESIVADLARMPHLLIAGSTGAGKSVCINTIICSILMKANPYQVRMLMVDPKVVELNIYNDIPHLFTPVITDPKRAGDALRWAVKEMEGRYRRLASVGVRDIQQYNTKVGQMREKKGEDAKIPEPLPYIVIIIDEFADLMVVAANEVEESIARLAQMARAVGMHLVLATQRPSADVITGLIKANFPSRIAFKVMQASNSRIILDQSGADKLLGMGDMLFLQAGKPESVRLHGAFISSEESKRMVDYVSDQSSAGIETITDEVFRDENGDDDNALGLRDPSTRDPLFFKAARLVVMSNQGSASLLQRRLKVGYARAARIIDELELAGIVGPYDGSKAREVMVDDLYIDELEAGEL